MPQSIAMSRRAILSKVNRGKAYKRNDKRLLLLEVAYRFFIGRIEFLCDNSQNKS